MLNFIHLTDCHLTKQNTDTSHNINTYESLSRIIKHIKQNKSSYDFLLITGDISIAGSKEGYELFSRLIKTLNKPVYCLPGNHDNPFLLKQFFKSSPNQAISVNLIHSHLLILLNSSQKEFQSGEISENQLNQLNNILINNLNRPVIIALHHQPVKINSPWLDNIGLRNKETLLSLIEKHSTVKMVLFGHVHQEIEQEHQHIKMLGTPSTCYQFKPLHETMKIDDMKSGYRLIKLLNNGTIETKVHRI